MMGCTVSPQNPEFLARFRKEVLETVLRLRDHPSIALWSGNNEVDGFYKVRVGGGLAPDPNRDKPSREIIPDVLMEFDVSRPYLPSSPYFSPEVFAGKAQPSEVHLWGGGMYWKSAFYTNTTARFVSEIGYHGCPCIESLKEMFSGGNWYPWKDPADRNSWNDEWRIKATAPLMDEKFQPVLWNRLNQIRRPAEEMFGSLPGDFTDFVEASQLVQAEALKSFVEHHRTGKFAISNGILWWNLRDGWPVISDAVVDYYNRRKRSYFAIRAVQKDVLLAVRDTDRMLVAVNDRLHPVSGHGRCRDAETGRVLWEGRFTIPANGRMELSALDFSGSATKGAVLIDGEADGVDLRNHYLYGERPFSIRDVRKWLADRPVYDVE
jgi:beta-mannosidase